MKIKSTEELGMAKPKPKKKKKGGKKSPTSTSVPSEQEFDYAIYQSNVLQTSLSLLDTSEDAIVIKVLDKLIRFCNKHPSNKNRLIEFKVLDKLPKLIQTEILNLLKLSLKLTTILIEDPEVVDKLAQDEDKIFIRALTKYYTTHEDMVVQEMSLYLLIRLIGNDGTLSLLVLEGILGHVFRILKDAKDPDIQSNTLEFLNKLLDAPESKYVIQETEEFVPKILLCYNTHHPVVEVQDLALNILERITEFKQNILQIKMAEQKIVEAMLELIIDPEKYRFHKCAINIIMNSMQCEATAFNFLDSLEFLKFLEFIKTCTKEYILPVSKIMFTLTTFLETHQILNDFAAEDGLLSLFRLNDPMVHFYVCSAMKNLTQHRYMCEKILTSISLNFIMDMLRQKNLPEVFHDVALTTLYAFLKTNYRTLGMLHAVGLDVIIDMFLNHREKLKPDNWFMLLDIIHMFCCRSQFANTFLFRDMYKAFMQLLMADNVKVASRATIIMNCYANEQKAVEYFLDYEGPEMVMQKLATTSERLMKDLLVFIHNMIIHETVCMAFLKCNVRYILDCLSLEGVPEKVKEANPLIDRIIDRLHNMYLPLKFHRKGRLEVEDKLKSGFYLINGAWRGTFPFLEILEKQALSTFYTIYLVDYTGGQKPSGNDVSPSDISSDIWDLYSVSDPTSHLIRFGKVSPDPFMPNLVHIAGIGMYLMSEGTVLCSSHKAKSLAKFVERQTSGIILDSTPEQFTHYYKYHIACLKRKLGTNIIPIGYVRSGMHCERALLFKALADMVGLPATLARGKNGLYWNEVPSVSQWETQDSSVAKSYLAYAVVDLVGNVGNLMPIGSSEASRYCNGPECVNKE